MKQISADFSRENVIQDYADRLDDSKSYDRGRELIFT